MKVGHMSLGFCTRGRKGVGKKGKDIGEETFYHRENHTTGKKRRKKQGDIHVTGHQR